MSSVISIYSNVMSYNVGSNVLKSYTGTLMYFLNNE